MAGPVLAQDTPWLPPDPKAGTDDWIRLTSGEWLRGEFKLLRDDNVEFDSEELDLLKLDWDDIVELRSPRVLTYVFEEGETLTGTAAMRDGVLKVKVGREVREGPASDLVSIIEGELSEINFWSLRVSAGVVARSGNTNQVDNNAYLLLRRQATRSRFDWDYTGNWGELNGTENVNNHRTNAMLSIIVKKGFFITPGALGLYADKFQNIDVRFNVGAGVGIFAVRKSDLEIYFQLGAGYQSTRFVSVQPGEDIQEDSGNVIPAVSMEWDITGDIDFDVNYNSQIGVPDPKSTIHHLAGLFSIEIWGDLNLDLTFNWDRVENPKQTADGTTPERNDFRTAIGLGVDL